jgi:hypothetical protein
MRRGRICVSSCFPEAQTTRSKPGAYVSTSLQAQQDERPRKYASVFVAILCLTQSDFRVADHAPAIQDWLYTRLVSMRISRRSRYAILATAVLSSVVGWAWYSFVYSPKHLLRRINWATVTVDGREVAADVYIGQPTDNEADAFVLVHLPNAGDFLLNLDDESYRESSEHEYIRGKQRAWSLKPMQEGRFLSPSQMKLNEYIIVSHGHGVDVHF